MIRIVAALFTAWAICAQAQPRPDSCQAQIPRSLADVLARAFPAYRTPLGTDNSPDEIRYSQMHGGTGCPGVATADLTGEGKKDYLIGLTARKGSAGLTVIALPRKGGWRFERIRSRLENARVRQYVEAVEPGRFERPAAIAGALEAGERSLIDCPHWAARVGAIESTTTVYCYRDGQWLHVRTAQ